MENFYFKGMGRRLPVKAESEKHYAEKTPNFRCSDYIDFREMLEKAIDAVLIAPLDHLNGYCSVVAMRDWKHVCCEKPLNQNICDALARKRQRLARCQCVHQGN